MPRPADFSAGRGFAYNFFVFSHSKGMKRTRIFDGDGRTREETETCFPLGRCNTEEKNKEGVGFDG